MPKEPSGPSKPAEAEDPATAKLVAHARKVASDLADATADDLKTQAHTEQVQDQMRKGAAKTRHHAEQAAK